MKRFTFLIVLLVSSALTLMAQEAQVSRQGNTYYCGSQVMNKTQYRDFLSTRSTPAYEQFQKGYVLSNVGWGCFGTGLGVQVAGIGLVTAGVMIMAQDNGDDAKKAAGAFIGGSMEMTCGAIFCAVGGILEVASIPILCVGYNQMHNSVDIYNVEHAAPQTLSMGLVSDANGIGLALRF